MKGEKWESGLLALLALDLEGHKFLIVVLEIISFGFFVRQVGKQFFSQEVVDSRIPDQ